ncbi:hypothetical protein TWF696_000794 [Orbilia brochopaga]|uniref:Secreted protein n=1 Tax=Orbilia brochopaga TaxID=3140254 RepID=A0AAV9VIQ4_9PEZI
MSCCLEDNAGAAEAAAAVVAPAGENFAAADVEVPLVDFEEEGPPTLTGGESVDGLVTGVGSEWRLLLEVAIVDDDDEDSFSLAGG